MWFFFFFPPGNKFSICKTIPEKHLGAGRMGETLAQWLRTTGLPSTGYRSAPHTDKPLRDSYKEWPSQGRVRKHANDYHAKQNGLNIMSCDGELSQGVSYPAIKDDGG